MPGTFPQAKSSNPASPAQLTRFHVYRHDDIHGNTGCGVVAEGVIFTNGKCVLRWLHAVSSIATFESIADLLAIHGHSGKTVVITW